MDLSWWGIGKGERWGWFRLWGDPLISEKGLPIGLTCQGMTLGGRKFLTYTKETGPAQVQPVTWGGVLGGEVLSGHKSAGEQPALGARALGTHPSAALTALLAPWCSPVKLRCYNYVSLTFLPSLRTTRGTDGTLRADLCQGLGVCRGAPFLAE